MKNTLKIGFGFGLLFAIIAVPFPFYFFPNFSYGYSDSLLMYQITVSVFSIGVILGLFFDKITNNEKTIHFLVTSLAYILAFYLFKYGFDKLFLNQFYFPQPNTLHTPLGELSKDILFWSAMGASFWYNIFMGLIEIGPAILLLHRRTRNLGVYLAFGVLLNVWAINMSFDITVKILSTLLLLITTYLISFSIKRTILFFMDKEVGAPQKRIPILRYNPLQKRIIKGSIIALFCIESLLPHLQKTEIDKSNHLSESYTVIDLPKNATFKSDIIRIHFHNKGWMILENSKQEFKDYKIQINNGGKRIFLAKKNIKMTLQRKNQTSILSWVENGKNINCELAKIDLEKMVLKNDGWSFSVN